MGRGPRKIQVNLDSGEIRMLPDNEIAAILRGADDLIMSGGRTLLAKILKGLKVKKIKELSLDSSPVYGYYSDQELEDIQWRIDWVIENDFLKIEYDYRLPLLAYTEKGWEIEKETYASEILNDFDRQIGNNSIEKDMQYLKEKNREVIMLILQKIQIAEDKKYIPLLEHWQINEFKKVKKQINQVIKYLDNS